MSHRKTISREFFSTIAVVLILGLSVMCAIQTALSAAYFVNERRTALTAILDGASALSQRFAEGGSIVTRPLGDERAQDARSGFELFNTTSGALVFVASEDGQVLLHTDGAFVDAYGRLHGLDIHRPERRYSSDRRALARAGCRL